MQLGFITGLNFEADILRQATGGKSVATFCAGGCLARAEQGALSLIDQGTDIVISFGLAGALKPGLAPGDLIIADSAIRLGMPPLPCDIRLADRNSVTGPILSSHYAVTTPEEKARLHQKTGAIAVDMESYGAARAAGARGIPFAAIRAVADPADRAIPKAAMAGMGADGSLKIGAVLLELVKRPQDLPALIRLGQDTERAKESLRRAARLHFA